MKLVFAGTPEVAVPALDALIASGRHEVAAVVTRPDAPAGRGRRLVASPVAERAEEAGHRGAQARQAARPGLPGAAAGDRTRLLPRRRLRRPAAPRALDVPAQGWVNLHFSLLPAWRGAAPVQHAIMAGDEITGRVHLPHRGGAGLRPGLRRPSPRRSGPPTPAATCSPGSPSPAPGCSRRPWTASRTAPCRPSRSRPRASPSRPKITVEDAQMRLGRPGAPRRPRRARLHPRAGRLDPLPRASGSSSSRRRPSPTGTDLAPGELSVGKNNVYVGHRLARRRAALGAGAGQEADAGRGLGARRADRRRGAPRGLTRGALAPTHRPGNRRARVPRRRAVRPGCDVGWSYSHPAIRSTFSVSEQPRRRPATRQALPTAQEGPRPLPRLRGAARRGRAGRVRQPRPAAAAAEGAGEGRLRRAGRRAGHRAGVRDAASAGHLRRHHRRLRGPAAARGRPARARCAQPGRAPAARHPDPPACRRLRRPWSWRGSCWATAGPSSSTPCCAKSRRTISTAGSSGSRRPTTTIPRTISPSCTRIRAGSSPRCGTRSAAGGPGSSSCWPPTTSGPR